MNYLLFEDRVNLIFKRKIMGNEIRRYLDDDDFIDWIQEKARNELRALKSATILSAPWNYKCLSIALVMIAINSYNANYWVHVEEFLHNGDEDFTQRTESLIRELLSELNPINAMDLRPMDSALLHAIVPGETKHDFFSFVFDVYSKSFYYRLPDESTAKTILQLTLDFIRNDLSSINEIELSKKDYVLNVSLKIAIDSQEMDEYLIELMYGVISLIDANFWKVKSEHRDDYKLKMSVDKWMSLNRLNWLFINEDFKEEIRKKWFGSYKLKDKHVVLELPVIHNIDIVDPSKITVRLVQGERTRIISDVYVDDNSQNFNTLLVPNGNIAIDVLNTNVDFYVEHDGEILTSHESFSRKYILFDKKTGEEIQNYLPFVGEVCIYYSEPVNNYIYEQLGNCYLSYVPAAHRRVKFGIFEMNLMEFKFLQVICNQVKNVYAKQESKVIPITTGNVIIELKIPFNTDEFKLFINSKEFIVSSSNSKMSLDSEQQIVNYIVNYEENESGYYNVNLNIDGYNLNENFIIDNPGYEVTENTIIYKTDHFFNNHKHEIEESVYLRRNPKDQFTVTVSGNELEYTFTSQDATFISVGKRNREFLNYGVWKQDILHNDSIVIHHKNAGKIQYTDGFGRPNIINGIYEERTGTNVFPITEHRNSLMGISKMYFIDAHLFRYPIAVFSEQTLMNTDAGEFYRIKSGSHNSIELLLNTHGYHDILIKVYSEERFVETKEFKTTEKLLLSNLRNNSHYTIKIATLIRTENFLEEDVEIEMLTFNYYHFSTKNMVGSELDLMEIQMIERINSINTIQNSKVNDFKVIFSEKKSDYEYAIKVIHETSDEIFEMMVSASKSVHADYKDKSKYIRLKSSEGNIVFYPKYNTFLRKENFEGNIVSLKVEVAKK